MAETYTSRTLREIVRIVATRFRGMVLLFAAVVAATVATTLLSPKWYRSEVQLLVKPGRPVNPSDNPASVRDEVSLFVGYQRQLITSDYVLVSALLRLEGKPVQAVPAGQNEEAYPWYPDDVIEAYIHQNGKYLRKVQKRVEVVMPSGGADAMFTQTFAIRVDWPQERELGQDGSTDMAARQAKEFASYIRQASQMRYSGLEMQRSAKMSALLTEKSLEAAEANLKKAADQQRDYVQNDLQGDLLAVINMISVGGSGVETGIASLTTRFQAEINGIDSQLAQVRALQKVLAEELAKPPEEMAVPDAVIRANPSITAIQDKIVSLRLSINSLKPRYTEGYRETVSLQQELTGAMRELRSEMVKQETRLKQQLETMTAQRDALEKLVNVDRKRLDELAGKAVKYQQLQKNLEAAQTVYDAQQKQVVAAATAKALAQNPVLVTVLDRASPPDPKDPRRPIVWLNILVAMIAGLVLSLAYAFMADHFDHSIKGIDDAERYLGVPVLASIPMFGGDIITLGDDNEVKHVS